MPPLDGDAMQEDAHGELEENSSGNVKELAEPPAEKRDLRAVRVKVFEVLACAVCDANGLADEECREGYLERRSVAVFGGTTA